MKERLLYIDVLRGIAILTVVYSHILLFCVGYSETSFMTDLLRKYFLNAFFFLSGFMAYKKSPSLTLYQTGYFHELWKKVKQLLIPTLLEDCIVFIVQEIRTLFLLMEQKEVTGLLLLYSLCL